MNDPPSNWDSSKPASPSAALPRLAPATLGEILDRTIQLYRSRFLLYLGISLVPTAVVVIPACGIALSLAWFDFANSPAQAPGPILLGLSFVVIGLLAVPILIAAYALTLAAMPYAASREYLGEKTTIREAYKSVWRHGWRYCCLLILWAWSLRLLQWPYGLPS